MTRKTLTSEAWPATVERLGGRRLLEQEGRETGAFRRARELDCAVDCLRLVLAYCLGALGLRLTAARAEALGIASISNVALLKRVRKAVPWLECLVARQLAAAAPGERDIAAAHGRRVRLVDGTTVVTRSVKDKAEGGLWRVREQFDRAAVVAGEI